MSVNRNRRSAWVDRKKLIVWVEIDRCMADAVSAVTGVRLGKRSLKYVDYGKVAATFLNTDSGQAVRVVALESSRLLADERYPDVAQKRERQFRAYSEATDEELFKVESVRLVSIRYDRQVLRFRASRVHVVEKESMTVEESV